MATDDELLIYNTLNDNWNEGNASLPKFYYDDTIKLHDFNTYDAIKIYTVNVTEQPRGLGYVSYRKESFLTVDVRSKSRDRMMNCRDEIKRIIKLFRKSLTGYNICKMTSERKIASYIYFHQYILEISLLNYITTI